MNFAPSAVSWRWRIPALGLAQIIAWGSMFYAIAVIAGEIAGELGLSSATVFGAYTLSLVISGLLAPLSGRLIDAGHCRAVLGGSSLLGAAGFALLAVAEGPVVLFLAWAVLGLAMGSGLYDAAFGVLHRTVPAVDYRRAVTALTLFGGFASTVFWPLTRLLVEQGGWRHAAWVFVALHLLLTLPLYLMAVPRVQHLALETHARRAAGPALSGLALRRFRWLAAALALASFVVSVLSAHLITLLTLGGLSGAHAIFVGALFGPTQVVARIFEYIVARKVRAVTVGSFAFAAMVLAQVALGLAAETLLLPVLFALLYGASNGIMTIIRGTVPAQLFAEVPGFAALLGRLALPSFIAKAGAPFVFALLLDQGLPRAEGCVLLFCLALAASACYERARRLHG